LTFINALESRTNMTISFRVSDYGSDVADDSFRSAQWDPSLFPTTPYRVPSFHRVFDFPYPVEFGPAYPFATDFGPPLEVSKDNPGGAAQGTSHPTRLGFEPSGLGGALPEPEGLPVSDDFVPPDVLYTSQWHFGMIGRYGYQTSADTRGIDRVWDEFTGLGVAVGIWDDGVESTHPDLAANYDATKHVTVLGSVNNGQPVGTAPHGTAVAGLIAGVDNGTGVVGVAFDAKITGVTIFGGADDINSQWSRYLLTLDGLKNFDVTNHSYGIGNPFFQLEEDVAKFESSALLGRGGLGTINVKSAGNSNTDTNGNALDATRFTVTVAAIGNNDTGNAASYSSYGAHILVSAPAGSVTTDRTGAAGYNGLPGQEDYTNGFGGTSAAGPITAGVVALMLEANAGLGWRDAQNILAYAATGTGSLYSGVTTNENFAWKWNGADNWNGGSLHYSEDYGYGMVNAFNAVRMAEAWSLFYPTAATSANEAVATTGTLAVNQPIADLATLSYSFTVAQNVSLEHVALTVSLTHTWFKDLRMRLVAPDGTVMTIYNGSTGSSSTSDGTFTYTFGVDGFRGVASAGDWTLQVQDVEAPDSGTLYSVNFTGYGSTVSNNDVYHYTDEVLTVLAQSGQDGRMTLADTDGGTDWIDAAAMYRDLVLDLNAGETSTLAGTSFLAIAGGTAIENALAGDGNDDIIGNASFNALYGMRGEDSIEGGGGADTLVGGMGNDTLTGGSEADRFEFAASGNGVDRITDWTVGDYVIVEGAAFTTPINDGDGSTTGLNAVQVSRAGGQTWLHIGTDSVAGADVVIKLDGTWDTARFVAAGNQISYQFNTAPTATGVPTDVTVTEDTASNFDLSAVTVADVDGNPLTVTLAASAGTFAATSAGGVTVSGTGTGSLTLSGTAAAINTYLDAVSNIRYTGALNASGNNAATFTLKANDGTEDSPVSNGNIDITAVNDAPTATNLSAPETYTEDTPLNLTDIVVSDVDSANVTVRLTLSNKAAGALSTATSGAVTSTYNAGTGVWSASGARADVNTLLAGLSFNPALNFNGAFTVATSVSDGVAPSVTGTKAFTGTPRNDMPTGGVSITGTALMGQVLKANTTTLADVEGLGTLHYQWLRGGVAIAGAADAATYTTVLADVGAKISLRVSYTDGGNTAESVLSSPTTTIGVPMLPPAGMSTMTGSGGNDYLVGKVVNILLLGLDGADTLISLNGNDWLDGGTGIDTMTGGTGNDTYIVDSLSDQVNEKYLEGTDTVIASVNYVLGLNLENLYLSGSANITGTGNADANLIIGNAGNNTLAGKLGNDTLIGGDGLDVFVFDTAPSASNRDTILNFIVADDTIQLNKSVFTALTPGALAPGAFVTGVAALDANDRIIYNSATGALLYDADGTGATAAVQFATLIGVVGTLSAADFVVV
jgi:Ca2+-binding RTX toxin-like protein